MDRKLAIVTGASRGIGRAIAIELGRLGFGVVVNFRQNAEAAAEVVREIELAAGGASESHASSPGRAIAVQADISRAEDRDRLITAALESFGRIDVLVNNAGITSPGRKDLLEVDEQGWDEVFGTNLKGPFFLAQAVAQKMIEQSAADRRPIASSSAESCASSLPKSEPWAPNTSPAIPGRTIINISSISAYAVSRNRADYCMTKAALGMMTLLFAERLAEHDIRVYEICPGVVRSDMTQPVQEKYDRLIAEGLTPIRRWGEPEDVAQAVAALVSGYFPFSTGERFNVDGGFHIRRV